MMLQHVCISIYVQKVTRRVPIIQFHVPLHFLFILVKILTTVMKIVLLLDLDMFNLSSIYALILPLYVMVRGSFAWQLL